MIMIMIIILGGRFCVSVSVEYLWLPKQSIIRDWDFDCCISQKYQCSNNEAEE